MPAYLLSHFSGVQLFVTSWTVAHQVPLSMKFPRQEYWSGLPFPPIWDFPNPRIKPTSPVAPISHVDSLLTEPSWKPFVLLISSLTHIEKKEKHPVLIQLKKTNGGLKNCHLGNS